VQTCDLMLNLILYKVKIAMKVVLAFVALALILQIAKAEEESNSNVTSSEICLSGYARYVEILKRIYE